MDHVKVTLVNARGDMATSLVVGVLDWEETLTRAVFEEAENAANSDGFAHRKYGPWVSKKSALR